MSEGTEKFKHGKLHNLFITLIENFSQRKRMGRDHPGDLGIDDSLNTGCENMDGTHLAQDRSNWLALMNTVAE